MTIREQLRHAREYGYPVVVHDPTFGDGDYYTGTIRSMEKDAFSMQIGDESRGLLLGDIDEVVILLPSSDDGTPDSEIAEIDRDEVWEWVYASQVKVKAWERREGGNVYLRTVAEFAYDQDGKAAATLPELVRQRDKLLEASKALVEWKLADGYRGLRKVILEIEKNPLIRLTDSE